MTVIRSAVDAAVRAAVKSSKKSEPGLARHLTRGVWTAALVLGLGAGAQAQEKPAADTTAQQSGGSLEEITVTTPTAVVDASYRHFPIAHFSIIH